MDSSVVDARFVAVRAGQEVKDLTKIAVALKEGQRERIENLYRRQS